MVDVDDTVVDGRTRFAIAARRAGLPYTGRTRSVEALLAGLRPAERAARLAAFRESYFADDALARLDRPQPGAREFVAAVRAAGGRVVYLTGRWESRRAPTEALLRRLGFPLDDPRDLVMNRDEHALAIDHKRAAAPRVRSMGDVVALFDNEPGGVRVLAEAFPSAALFRLRTLAFGADRRPPPAGVTVIAGFDASPAPRPRRQIGGKG